MKRKAELDELRDKSLPELHTALRETREGLFQNRVRFATRNLDSIAPLRAGRKRVARILTLIHEREQVASAASTEE